MTNRIHLVAVSSEICEESYEYGEGEYTGAGIQHMKIGRTFDNMDDAVIYLHELFNLSADSSEYDIGDDYLASSITVSNNSDAQNGGWFEPTEKEYAEWREGKTKLYSEHYVVTYLKVA